MAYTERKGYEGAVGNSETERDWETVKRAVKWKTRGIRKTIAGYSLTAGDGMIATHQATWGKSALAGNPETGQNWKTASSAGKQETERQWHINIQIQYR